MNPGRDPWTYFTVLGAVVLVAAAFALTTRHRSQAAIGLVLGAGAIVVSEWSRWRSRG